MSKKKIKENISSSFGLHTPSFGSDEVVIAKPKKKIIKRNFPSPVSVGKKKRKKTKKSDKPISVSIAEQVYKNIANDKINYRSDLFQLIETLSKGFIKDYIRLKNKPLLKKRNINHTKMMLEDLGFADIVISKEEEPDRFISADGQKDIIPEPGDVLSDEEDEEELRPGDRLRDEMGNLIVIGKNGKGCPHRQRQKMMQHSDPMIGPEDIEGPGFIDPEVGDFRPADYDNISKFQPVADPSTLRAPKSLPAPDLRQLKHLIMNLLQSIPESSFVRYYEKICEQITKVYIKQYRKQILLEQEEQNQTQGQQPQTPQGGQQNQTQQSPQTPQGGGQQGQDQSSQQSNNQQGQEGQINPISQQLAQGDTLSLQAAASKINNVIDAADIGKILEDLEKVLSSVGEGKTVFKSFLNNLLNMDPQKISHMLSGMDQNNKDSMFKTQLVPNLGIILLKSLTDPSIKDTVTYFQKLAEFAKKVATELSSLGTGNFNNPKPQQQGQQPQPQQESIRSEMSEMLRNREINKLRYLVKPQRRKK